MNEKVTTEKVTSEKTEVERYLDYIIEYYTQMIKNCRETFEETNMLKEAFGDCLHFSFQRKGFEIRIVVKDLDELHAVRQQLRKLLGTWDDKFHWVQCCAKDWVEASFKSESHPRITIILKTTVDDFPKELKGPNCRFEYIQSPKTLTYTCSDR